MVKIIYESLDKTDYNAVVLDPLVILDRYCMIDWRDGCSCVVLVWAENTVRHPCAVYFSKSKSFQVRPNFLGRVKTQWLFPLQVSFFFTTAFFVPVLRFRHIDHALYFYYTCRYWQLRYRRIGLTHYTWYRLLQRLPSAPKGGLSPSRLVPSLVSFHL